MGPLVPLFCTSGDVCPGFQSQGGIPCLHAPSPACEIFFRFSSGTTPTDLLAASMAAEPFHPHTCICIQALVGLKPKIKHVSASQHVTRQMLY